jgi:hypothetical protein
VESHPSPDPGPVPDASWSRASEQALTLLRHQRGEAATRSELADLRSDATPAPRDTSPRTIPDERAADVRDIDNAAWAHLTGTSLGRGARGETIQGPDGSPMVVHVHVPKRPPCPAGPVQAECVTAPQGPRQSVRPRGRRESRPGARRRAGPRDSARSSDSDPGEPEPPPAAVRPPRGGARQLTCVLGGVALTRHPVTSAPRARSMA